MRDSRELEILLWRNWTPDYDFASSFSAVFEQGMGGTVTQMLWHARNLTQMGHRVQVLGASRQDVVEEGVEFLGAADRASQLQMLEDGRVRPPDAVFLEGGYQAAELFKTTFPSAKVVHVGQNIDPGADRQAFALQRFIDAFAFVAVGHLADYSQRFPRLRHKFTLIRNCVPWSWIHRDVPSQAVVDHVLWVGSWGKKGLRFWARAMEKVLAEFPGYRFTLCGPRYSSKPEGLPPWIFRGLKMPESRVAVKSLPLAELLHEITSARIVLASLGNECGPISALDAHAMGRPVLSGNDMVYKFSNPNGTGCRVSTVAECYEAVRHLLLNPALCDRLGAHGKAFVLQEYTEREQRADLEQLLGYLRLQDELGPLDAYPATSYAEQRRTDFADKVKRRLLRAMGD